MLKRSVIATGIFIGLIFVLLVVCLAPTLVDIFREVTHGASATAIHFRVELGSPTRVLAGVFILAALGIVAYWLSGKVVRA